jgi:hypothetical protein
MKKLFLGVITLIALLNISCGQTKVDKLDALVSAYADYGKFNGSVLVAEKGEVIYKKGFGLANMEWDIPNEPDTKFRLASVTKQFTAMLILQLVAENKLKLDAPISTYLPDYPKKTGDIITIHQLLTHSSGIPNYTDFPVFTDMMRDAYRSVRGSSCHGRSVGTDRNNTCASRRLTRSPNNLSALTAGKGSKGGRSPSNFSRKAMANSASLSLFLLLHRRFFSSSRFARRTGCPSPT